MSMNTPTIVQLHNHAATKNGNSKTVCACLIQKAIVRRIFVFGTILNSMERIMEANIAYGIDSNGVNVYTTKNAAIAEGDFANINPNESVCVMTPRTHASRNNLINASSTMHHSFNVFLSNVNKELSSWKTPC
mmetsp:Transcript_5131/g.5826  ORF Transcript_5131/g.5826 Transcript_5131/m.5826 type:complete len:133 (+) Transcript_5131:263-661(+)